jgi:hypothetical protein
VTAVVGTEADTGTAELDDLEAIGGDGNEDCAEPLETGIGTT